MESYTLTITLQSAFATSLLGDTLFGQLCWAVRNRFGEPRLNELLTGYTEDKPFAVISDAFPEGYVPLPKLPSFYYQKVDSEARKALKKQVWLPVTELQKPIADWQKCAVKPADINTIGAPPSTGLGIEVAPSARGRASHGITSLSEKHPQPHNSINRLTGATGDGFAPYSIEQEWFIPGLHWEQYILLDTRRFSPEDFRICMDGIGTFGFGRDASIGLGKFHIEAFQAQPLPAQANANACLTLASCAPQRLGFEQTGSFYQLFTRFGRHGDIAVCQGKPFKNPVLLAKAGAVFSVQPPRSGFIGQGIGGNGQLSKTLPKTVQQGYSPIIPIHFPEQSAQDNL
jgi:CRISPR-associated protein Csm4